MSETDRPGARTTVVTVAHDSAGVLPAMLASVPAGTPVVIVDNASGDDSAEIARAAGADLVALPENQGFGRGCNAGAARAETEFLLFLNPDARLAPGAIAALEAAADAMPTLVAANPAILRPDGRADFKTSSILRPRATRLPHRPPTGPAPVPILTGAAFFCRRAAFRAVGGFDPAIFLYHEDHDLAVRLSPDGGGLWYIPEARVTHAAGTGSPRRADMARFKGYQMARSRAYVLAKHGHAWPHLRTLLPATLGLLAPHVALSARRRARALGQIAGALAALRQQRPR